MKKFITLLTVFTLLFVPVALAETYSGYSEGDWRACTVEQRDNNIAVTDTNTKYSLSADAKALLIWNRGSNEIFYDYNDGVAEATDTGGTEVPAGESRNLGHVQARDIGLIASSGETSNVQIVACY
jgi:hypothetical protein